jgi:uncharacterized protein (UPF0276 family)
MVSAGSSNLVQQYGLGLGLRPKHFADVLEGRPQHDHVSWFEIVSDNYLGSGGRPLFYLEKVRRDFPIALHGISMNLGSVDPLDLGYLGRLKDLADRVEPFAISDHLCWTAQGGQQLHDLLPLPYTREAVSHVSARISKAQELLGRRILIENVSTYLEYSHSEMAEWEFVSEIARQSDCGLLLDVNNIYVSAVNHRFDPMDYLNGIPLERVGQIHLAGHSRYRSEAGETYLIDTHSKPVCAEVWDLYAETVKRIGAVNAMIEWDADIPEWSGLYAELLKAKQVQERVCERSA